MIGLELLRSAQVGEQAQTLRLYQDYEVALLALANDSSEHPLTILKDILRQLLPPSVPLEFFLTQKYGMCHPVNVGFGPWFSQTLRLADELLEYMNCWVIAYNNLTVGGDFTKQRTGLLKDQKIRPFSSYTEIVDFLAVN